MSLLNGGISDFFGLDIGTSAIRLVELKTSGGVKVLSKYGYVPINVKLANSDAESDQKAVAQIVKDLITKVGVSSKNVAVGIPTQRVFTTVVDIDRLSNDELAKTIKFQADSLIPTPLADSKIDWGLIGDSPVDKTKVEILLSSVPNDYVEKRLDLLESIGLNVIAFEPDGLALTRSMLAPDAGKPHMIVDIGNKTTDIVIAVDGIPRLTRSIATGSDAIIKAAMQNLNIDEVQAQQFVAKFGLSKEKLEGQIYKAISSTIEILTSEMDKSIKFFQSRYSQSKIEVLVVTGGASVIPEFPLFLANKFSVSVEIGNSWRNISFPRDRQNELMSLSNQFGVAAGLGERAL